MVRQWLVISGEWLMAREELGEAMKGLDVRQMEEKDLLQTRGW